MQVDPAIEVKRVFAYEPLQNRVVVSGAVEVNPRPVVLPARVLEGRESRADRSGVAEWLVGVLRQDVPKGIGQAQRAAQRITEQGLHAKLIGPREELPSIRTWPSSGRRSRW